MTRLRVRIGLGLVLAGLYAGSVCATDGDVVFKRAGPESETPPAVFPHWSHRIRYRCYACHPGLFTMQAGANPTTMDEIMAGKSCGACHNGTTAWPVTFETCTRCHAPK